MPAELTVSLEGAHVSSDDTVYLNGVYLGSIPLGPNSCDFTSHFEVNTTAHVEGLNTLTIYAYDDGTTDDHHLDNFFIRNVVVATVPSPPPNIQITVGWGGSSFHCGEQVDLGAVVSNMTEGTSVLVSIDGYAILVGAAEKTYLGSNSGVVAGLQSIPLSLALWRPAVCESGVRYRSYIEWSVDGVEQPPVTGSEVAATGLTQEELESLEAEMANCSDEYDPCRGSFTSVVPFIGWGTSHQQHADLYCLYAEERLAGNSNAASVLAASVVVHDVTTVTSYWGDMALLGVITAGPGVLVEVGTILTESVNGLVICGIQNWGWFEGGGKADSIIAHEYADTLMHHADDMPDSNDAIAIWSGTRNEAIEMGVGVARTDSTSLGGAAVLEFPQIPITLAAASNRVAPFGVERSGLFPGYSFSAVVDTGGTFALALMRTATIGGMEVLKYGPTDAPEGALLQLDISQDQTVPALRVDFEADGLFDEWLYPAGAVSGVASVEAPIRLYAAAPNPFNPKTTIAYETAAGQHATLAVYDLAGRQIRTLVNEVVPSTGRQEVTWDGRDRQGRLVAAGVYFYRLKVDAYSETKRMVLLK